MNFAHPWNVLTPTLEGEVLRVLATTTTPLTARALHQLCTTGSEQGVRNALNRLTEQGVVFGTRRGQGVLYLLNRKHLIAPAVNLMAHLKQELVNRIRRGVAAWRIQPLHLSLYGSAARGEGDARSDIDLLLIRRDEVDPEDSEWQNQLGHLEEAIYAWTGNRVSYLEQSMLEFRALFSSRAPLLREWQQDAIDLAGIDAMQIVEQLTN